MRVERIGRATLYNCNALDLPRVAAEVVITDPPYSSGGFNEAGKAGGSIGTTTKGRRIEGDTLSTLGYFNLMRRVLGNVEANGAYVFTDWRMWPHTTEAVELSLFRVRGMLVWDKGSPAMGSRWKSQHELICWGSRVSHEMGPGFGNVLTAPRSGNIEHPTQKPLSLMRKLISNCEGSTIFDPFMGSGTTGIAAALEGKAFIGCELDPQHFETACRRIREATGEDAGPLFGEAA